MFLLSREDWFALYFILIILIAFTISPTHRHVWDSWEDIWQVIVSGDICYGKSTFSPPSSPQWHLKMMRTLQFPFLLFLTLSCSQIEADPGEWNKHNSIYKEFPTMEFSSEYFLVNFLIFVSQYGLRGLEFWIQSLQIKGEIQFKYLQT